MCYSGLNQGEQKMLNEQELSLYQSLLDQYVYILRKNPSKEILQTMIGVIGEHDSAKIVNGSVTNGKGSDVTCTENKTVQTKSGPVEVKKGHRIEVKSMFATVNNGKKIRAQQIIHKEGKCEHILLCDYRPEYNRKFLIPADVFYSRALFNDVGYTNSFTWDADYIPKGIRKENTKFVQEYEIT